MAGSYHHCVDPSGRLYPNDGENDDMLDHLGDAREAIEEMYWAIQWLAHGNRDVIEAAIRGGHELQRKEASRG